MTMMEPNAGLLHVSLVIGVYILVQTAEAILIPLIMGRDIELHPVTLIVALLLCGKLLGVLGLILAVPIFATARILAREYLWPWLRQWAEGIPQPPTPLQTAGPSTEQGAGSGERG
jgi:predicted PurR-regulated permease PerM